MVHKQGLVLLADVMLEIGMAKEARELLERQMEMVSRARPPFSSFSSSLVLTFPRSYCFNCPFSLGILQLLEDHNLERRGEAQWIYAKAILASGKHAGKFSLTSY